MKISTKGTYALEIIVDLAMHSEPDRLARNTMISSAYEIGRAHV